MKCLLKQVSKELYSAKFEILNNNSLIGELNLKGHLGTNEVKLIGKIFDKEFSMKRQHGEKEKFRPYSIMEEKKTIGEVYQTEIKTGFFKSKVYKKCIINNEEYNSYGIGFDDKGINCIYDNTKQIAQYENSSMIYNDLYCFDIYCKNEKELLITIFFAIHGYIIAFYEAGEKVTKSVKTFKSNSKEWIEKYDPEWINKIGMEV